jgi:transcriptional regulator with PAS, ATPase and Fis domain
MLNLIKKSKSAAQIVQEALSVGKSTVDAKIEQLARTQALVSQAVEDACKTTIALQAQLARGRDEGILFIDYQGIILHANQAAHKVLNCEADQLIGKSIEALLTPKARRVRQHILDCSKALFSKLQAKLDLAQVAAACMGFSFCLKSVADDVTVTLNAPITVPLAEGAITMRLSLLDVAPATLEDVTYLCKLSQS